MGIEFLGYGVRAACSLGCLSLWLTPAGAQPLLMSAEEFASLSGADQQALLVRVFEHRLEHAANLYYEARETIDVHEYHDGQPVGPPQKQLGGDDVRFWQLGSSYRMDFDRWRKEGQDPVVSNSFGFSAQEGVGRRMSKLRDLRNPDQVHIFGRVDQEHNPRWLQGRFQYWLDGEFPHPREYFFRDLIARQEEFIVRAPVENGLVELTVDYDLFARAEPGTRVVLLDPEKGFLPVRGEARGEDLSPEGRHRYRKEGFVVHESRLVEDVWMPVRFTHTIASSAAPDICNIHNTEILQIEHGKVVPKDLKVLFPEGTRVVDAVRGVTYVADRYGNPVAETVQPLLYGVDPADIREIPSVPPEQVVPVIRGAWLNVRYLGVGIVGLLVAFLVVWGARGTSRGGA